VGVARSAGTTVDYSMLEFRVREALNKTAPRVMAVLDPVRLVIENYPEGRVEWFDMPYYPAEAGGPPAGYAGPLTRAVPFSREILIEREDFRENAPKKFFRLAPGREVRLRYAYYVTCTGVSKDANGAVTEIRCLYDPASRGGGTPDGRKVKGALHWVEAQNAIPAEVRLYGHLFGKENPEDCAEGGSFLDNLNPGSLRVVAAACEPALADSPVGRMMQFERLGYFRVDEDSGPGGLVCNRTVTLRDAWVRIERKEGV
jgi:glutaminyl-tRNA synthetase